RWQLAAAPSAGWDGHLGHLNLYRSGGIALALLLSLMLWEILRDRRAIRHLALHDSLTGLPNRRLFDERLHYTLTQSQRQRGRFALLYIDLDNLKPVNDTHGHKAGDTLLRAIATRLHNGLRKGDTVARIGGDEFIVILPGAGTLREAEKMANHLLAAISTPYEHKGLTIEPNASIGIALYPESADNAEALLRAADEAMYQAKSQGKGQIRLAPAPPS
ncbi:MAG: diguanylate cyclase domain-containing protein, partial [Pseudomonadota bacterium]